MRAIGILAAFILAGCGTQQGLLPQPSPNQLSTPQGILHATAVDLHSALARCKQSQVKHPARWGDRRLIGEDMNQAWRAESHGLSVANGRITSENGCVDDVAREAGRGL